jgi:hypothetical protein
MLVSPEEAHHTDKALPCVVAFMVRVGVFQGSLYKSPHKIGPL